MKVYAVKHQTIEFVYKNSQYKINNDKSAIYHISNSLIKLEKMIEKITDKHNIVFDICANNGLFTSFLKTRFPDATVYIFEPDNDLIECIKYNTKGFSNIHIINKAVSNEKGNVKFYINENSKQTNSTEKSAVEFFNTDIKEVIVDSIDLDSFVKENNIEKIDILKVDIQDAESKMIDGANRSLSIVKYAFFEISFLDKDVFGLIKKLSNYFSDEYEVINQVIMGADLMLKGKSK